MSDDKSVINCMYVQSIITLRYIYNKFQQCTLYNYVLVFRAKCDTKSSKTYKLIVFNISALALNELKWVPHQGLAEWCNSVQMSVRPILLSVVSLDLVEKECLFSGLWSLRAWLKCFCYKRTYTVMKIVHFIT